MPVSIRIRSSLANQLSAILRLRVIAVYEHSGRTPHVPHGSTTLPSCMAQCWQDRREADQKHERARGQHHPFADCACIRGSRTMLANVGPLLCDDRSDKYVASARAPPRSPGGARLTGLIRDVCLCSTTRVYAWCERAKQSPDLALPRQIGALRYAEASRSRAGTIRWLTLARRETMSVHCGAMLSRASAATRLP